MSMTRCENDWRRGTRYTGKRRKLKKKEKEKEQSEQRIPMFSRWMGEKTAGWVEASAAMGAGTANLAGEGKAAGAKKAEKGVRAAKAAETASGTGRQHTSEAEPNK